MLELIVNLVSAAGCGYIVDGLIAPLKEGASKWKSALMTAAAFGISWLVGDKVADFVLEETPKVVNEIKNLTSGKE